MRITARTIALAACLALPAMPALAQTAPVFKSVSIDLPFGDETFPGGAAAEAVGNNCIACHSPAMVLNQPKLSKAAWEGVVHKMIDVYKAPIDPGDVAAIVAYLVQTKGTP